MRKPALLIASLALAALTSAGARAEDPTFRIEFKDGVVTDAECGEDTGERAFFSAMCIREGRFSYERGVEAQEVRIYRTAQHLIMDTLRLMDESS